jgi:putative AlgH/UPF0301 family transcriptional regulator
VFHFLICAQFIYEYKYQYMFEIGSIIPSPGSTTLQQGHLLVSNPLNPSDELANAVILITSSTAVTTVGIQVNNIMHSASLKYVMHNMGIPSENADYLSPEDLIWCGGQYVANRMHVIHSDDWSSTKTIRITDQLYVTNEIAILTAISAGQGPAAFKACAGHWQWDTAELVNQLASTNFEQSEYRWLTIPADTATVFSLNQQDLQWRKALDICTKQQVQQFF